MPDWPVTGGVDEVMISPHSELALGSEYAAVAAATPGSIAGGTANLAKFYPFWLPEPMLVVKLWWINGTTVNGTTSAGILDEWGTLLVSSGSQTQANGSVIQEFDITDTVIFGPGRFYMGLSTSSTISTYQSNSVLLQLAKIFGWCQMATAHPLPSTVTFAALAAAVEPMFGCSARTLVV